MTADQIIFIICAAVILVSALMVVLTQKLIHAALWLVSALFGVAILFAILQASFLAVVQVVVYIGAIAILFIFAVMLTRREMLDKGVQTRANWWINIPDYWSTSLCTTGIRDARRRGYAPKPGDCLGVS
jgi:NADH-quinone oxidoreductase subunit J